MVFESLLWSILLFIFMSNIHLLLMIPSSTRVIQNVTLAIGAGIYEEFLFRVILIFLLKYILGLIFQWGHF